MSKLSIVAIVLVLSSLTYAVPITDTIYIGSSNTAPGGSGTNAGKIWMRNSDGVHVQSTVSMFGDITAMTTQSNGNLVVGNAAGQLFIVAGDNLMNVKGFFENFTGGIVDISVQSDDDIVVATPTTLYLRNPDGTHRLYYMGFGNGISCIATQSDGTVVLGRTDGYVQLVDADTMVAFKTVSLGSVNVVDVAVQSDNGIIVAGTNTVYCNTSDLTSKYWRTNLGNAVKKIAILADNNIVVGRSDNNAHIFRSDVSTMDVLATQVGFGNLTNLAVQKDGDIVVTNANALYIRASNLTTGKYSTTGFSSANTVAVQNFVLDTCDELIAAGQGLKGDVDGNCKVNFADFAEIAKNWLNCNNPVATQCN